MSLDSLRTHTSNNNLVLYSEIERSLVPLSGPQPDTLPPRSKLNWKLIAPRKSPWITLLFVTLAIVGVVSTMHYGPWEAIDPYRPSALAAQLKTIAISTANQWSDKQNFDTCMENGGRLVQEELQYCILNNTKWYRETAQVTGDTATSVPRPLQYGKMNVFDDNISIPQKTVYSGYSSSKQQYITQVSWFEKDPKSIDSTTAGGVTSLVSSIPGYESVVFGDVINYVEQVSDLSSKYFSKPELVGLGYTLVENKITELHQIIVFSAKSGYGVVTHRLNDSLVEAFAQGLQKKCTGITQLSTCISDVSKDSSIAARISSDWDELVTYTALTN